MKQILHIFLITALVLAATLPANAQNNTYNQRINIHDVSIIPPKHFEYDTISGRIFHQGSMASIQIQTITNRNFKRITSAITEKYMKTQGLELLCKQETTMQDGNEAITFRSRFKSHDANGKELYFIRLMLFTGDKNTIWATADFPECMEKLIEKPITSCLQSISQK